MVEYKTEEDNSPEGKDTRMNEVKTPKKPLIFYFAIVAAVLLFLNLFAVPSLMQRSIIETDYGTFMDMTDEGNVGIVEMQQNQILFTDKDGEHIYKTGLMPDPGLTERLHDSGARFGSVIVEETSPWVSFLLSWVLPIILFAAIGYWMNRQLMKKAGGGPGAMSFGKSNAKIYVQSSSGIMFPDVGGEDEAKENQMEIVH